MTRDITDRVKQNNEAWLTKYPNDPPPSEFKSASEVSYQRRLDRDAAVQKDVKHEPPNEGRMLSRD